MNHFSIVSINSDKQHLLSEDPSVPRTTAASTSKHQSVKTLKKTNSNVGLIALYLSEWIISNSLKSQTELLNFLRVQNDGKTDLGLYALNNIKKTVKKYWHNVGNIFFWTN